MVGNGKYKDKNWLYKKYVTEERTLKSIADDMQRQILGGRIEKCILKRR
jgi:hypothetical protein